MLVFVPLHPSALAQWASNGVHDVQGFAATGSFLDAFDLVSGESEDADLTLLEIAGVEGLLVNGVRLIAVGDIDADGVEPAEFGAVSATAVPWTRVDSLFADDEEGAASASRVRAALDGALLPEAWEAEETMDLLRTTELLWHGPTEWQGLSAR